MLRQERELRGLTLQQAAEELNLDRWILEAIEVDRFLALGAPVYARGHLRKYAALLGLSQEMVVDRYDSLTGTPSAPVVTSTTTAHMQRRSRRERTGQPSCVALVVDVAGGARRWRRRVVADTARFDQCVVQWFRSGQHTGRDNACDRFSNDNGAEQSRQRVGAAGGCVGRTAVDDGPGCAIVCECREPGKLAAAVRGPGVCRGR